jgi:formylglycine-generating enzyme required for sulfatase activity
LPTEVEWEFAARSGSMQHNISATGWFRENSATASGSDDFRQIDAYAPHPVATKQADSRGLYDLLGNVWEWCSTLMKPYPYNADDGRELMDAPGLRVLRGGSFADSADYLQPTLRHSERPDRRMVFNGVRLVRTVPAP